MTVKVRTRIRFIINEFQDMQKQHAIQRVISGLDDNCYDLDKFTKVL